MGNELHKSKYNRMFLRYFVILVFSTILPVLFLIVAIYQQSASVIQKQAHETMINMLDKTSQSVDLVLKEINQKLVQLVDSGQITDFAVNYNEDNFNRDIDIINSMRNIVSYSEYIVSIYAYSENGNKIITSDGGIYNMTDFYDKGWLGQYFNLFHGKSSYRGVHRIDTRESQDMWDKGFNYITLIAGLPYGLEKKMGGVILNIDENRLYNLIGRVYGSSGGDILVVNSSL